MTVSPALSWTGDDRRSGFFSPVQSCHVAEGRADAHCAPGVQPRGRPGHRSACAATDDGGVLGVGGSSPRCRGRVPGAAQHLGCF
jgi:hypothetical protein